MEKDKWMWTQNLEDVCGRIDEPESTVRTAAQDEVLTPCPATFDSDNRNDEVAVGGDGRNEWR